MTWLEAIIVAIVEGLTEFLPISSTGHMVIAEKLMHMEETDFVKLYMIAIQLGAIMAVLVLYRNKFFNFKNPKFFLKLIIGVLPALVIGFLFSNQIDNLLESATTVAWALLLGGIFFLFVDDIFKNPTIANERDISFKNSFIVGCFQCIALIPGVSRSAATIIGGMQQRFTRTLAAEYSFFLAVPTMFAATVYKLYKYLKGYGSFETRELAQLLVGNVVAFIVAVLAIKFFIGFLQKRGFKVWGIYRIVVGIILLFLIYKGVIEP